MDMKKKKIENYEMELKVTNETLKELEYHVMKYKEEAELKGETIS